MELHNIVEDSVMARVDEIFASIKKEGNPDKLCICDHCRMDVICFVLNRIPPHYILSSRGAIRTQWETIERQQQSADIAAVIHEGLKRVNHNQRPNFSHAEEKSGQVSDKKKPVFNVPTIMGRIFNGDNFAPITDAVVELLWNGEPVLMKNGNWQNPFQLVQNTEGNFSFWPAPADASKVGNHKIFEYTLRVTSPGLETLDHFFKIPVASEIQMTDSFSLNRTFKLPDLYMFIPGEAEKNGYLD